VGGAKQVGAVINNNENMVRQVGNKYRICEHGFCPGNSRFAGLCKFPNENSVSSQENIVYSRKITTYSGNNVIIHKNSRNTCQIGCYCKAQ